MSKSKLVNKSSNDFIIEINYIFNCNMLDNSFITVLDGFRTKQLELVCLLNILHVNQLLASVFFSLILNKAY